MQVWINNDSPKNVSAIAETLEKSVKANSSKELKAFVLFIPQKNASADALKKQLEKLGKDKKLEQVHLAYLEASEQDLKKYRVNSDPKVKNTVFLYRNKRVTAKFVNLNADKKGINALNEAIKKTVE